MIYMANSLSLDDYRRYGRQMILEGFGLPGTVFSYRLETKSDLYPGQLKLCNASVVVVGAGGLGCPALQYLGSSGIGSKFFLLLVLFLIHQ